MEGRTFAGRYVVVAELGRGGMGVVYRARDESLDREVALKVLRARGKHQSELAARFEREARVVARFDHPNVLPVYDFGREEDGLFLVMPLVDGDNLRALLSTGALTLGEVLDVLSQVALGLAYSHERGVVHRDVKPENVMVERGTAGLRARLADFGLAVGATDERLTQSGALVGTVAYLAPEQAVGAPVDGRTDIYALGTMLYECLAGALPFDGPTPSILYRLVHEVPARPIVANRAIDAELADLAMRCLAKDPSDRPDGARKVADALISCRARFGDAEIAAALHSTVQVELSATRIGVAPSYVGRERERSEISARLQRAAGGECQLVLVAGERGMGKTRLVEEIERISEVRGVIALRGQFAEQRQSIPFQGFGELIESFLKRASSKPGSRTPDISDLAPDLARLFPTLEAALGRRGALGFAPALSTGSEQTQVFELLARTLARIAEGGPLVLFLEGLHDATVSVEALKYVVRRISHTPTLFIGTYSTAGVGKSHPVQGLIAAFEDSPRFLRIDLRPFTTDEHRVFSLAYLGGAVDTEVLDRIYAIADGNPYFTRELLASMRETRALIQSSSGQWSFADTEGVTELPQTVQVAVERRLERLPEGLRSLLSRASILGRSFDAADLESLAGEDGDLDEALEQLIRLGLFEEEGRGRARSDRLRFASGAVHDVLYASLPRRRRRTLHRRTAEAMERRHGVRLHAVRAQLLHHFAEGDCPAKVLEHGLLLAEAALGALSADDAIRAIRVVLEVVDEDETGCDVMGLARARIALSRAQKMSGNTDAAIDEARLASRALSSLPGDDAKRGLLAALSAGADAAWSSGRVAAAAPLLDRALAVAREIGDHASLLALLPLRASLASLQGDLATARALAQEAEPASRPSVPPSRVALSSEPVVVAFARPTEAREPALSLYNEEAEVLANVFETLVTADSEGRLGPGLAARWEVSDDGRRATFWLREGARAHDGRDLDATDVKRSFERLAKLRAELLPSVLLPVLGLRPFLQGTAPEIVGIRVEAPLQVSFDLDPPMRIFPCMTVDSAVAIACPDPRDPDGDWTVGSGPFRLDHHQPERTTLVRHGAYSGGALPSIERLEFSTGNSSAELARGFRAGRFDIVRDLAPEDAEDILRRGKPPASLVTEARKGVWFAVWNRGSAPASSEAFRRAVFDVLPLEDLLLRSRGPLARSAECLLAPGLLGHDPAARRPRGGVDEAREVLAASPHRRLTVLIHPSLAYRFGEVVEGMVAAWHGVGLEVDTVSDAHGYAAAVEKPDGVDLWLLRFYADYPDPDGVFNAIFHSEAGWCRAFWSSPDLDVRLDEARSEPAMARRQALYRKLDADLVRTGAVLPLWYDRDYRLIAGSIKRFRLLSEPPYVAFTELSKVTTPSAREVTRRTLDVPLNHELVSIDPSRFETFSDAFVQVCCFESLTREGRGARIEPWLAEHIAAEDGCRRYRIRLREGVRFHDGRLLTSLDVRTSFERMLVRSPFHHVLGAIRGAPELRGGSAEHLAGFQRVSDLELTLDFDEPMPMLPALLSAPYLSIAADGTSFENAAWREGVLGTGPLRVVRCDATSLELEPAPHCWRAAARRCDRVVFHFGVSTTEMVEGVQQGRFAIASSFGGVAPSTRPLGSSVVQRITPPLGAAFVAFNSARGVFADPAARHGAFDAIEGAWRGLALQLGDERARSIIPPTFLGSAEPRRRSATALPSFHGGGARLRLGASPLGGRRERLLASLTPVLTSLGFEVEAIDVSGAIENDPTSIDLLVTGWVPGFPDPDAMVAGLRQWEAFGFCRHVDVARISDEARSEADPRRRLALYVDLEEALARLWLAVPLFHFGMQVVASPRLRGLDEAIGVTRPIDPSLLHWDEGGD